MAKEPNTSQWSIDCFIVIYFIEFLYETMGWKD